jgi:hypothetical protein
VGTAGFLLEQGCGGGTRDEPCRNRPIFILRTNHLETGACGTHLLAVVLNAISEAQRYGGDGDQGYGMLHAMPRRSERIEQIAYDVTQVVWSSTLDEQYQVTVYEAAGDRGRGMLIVADSSGKSILRKAVHLTYGAVMGPDVDDVNKWMTDAVRAVDRNRPPEVLLLRALDQLEEDDRLRAAPLRSSPHAIDVFVRSLEVFATAGDAVDWLRRPNLALPRRSAPAQLLDDDSARASVLSLLTEIDQWDYRMAANP